MALYLEPTGLHSYDEQKVHVIMTIAKEIRHGRKAINTPHHTQQIQIK